MQLPIASLNLDFQPEENLVAEVVERYVSKFRHGDFIQAVTVYNDGLTFWLFDGFHRVKAATIIGRKEIDAEIGQGTFQDMEKQWAIRPSLEQGTPQTDQSIRVAKSIKPLVQSLRYAS